MAARPKTVGATEVVRIDENETRVPGIQADIVENRAVEQAGMVGRNDDGNGLRFHDEIVVPEFIETHAVNNGAGIAGTAGDAQEHSFGIGIMGGCFNLPCSLWSKGEFAHGGTIRSDLQKRGAVTVRPSQAGTSCFVANQQYRIIKVRPRRLYYDVVNSLSNFAIFLNSLIQDSPQCWYCAMLFYQVPAQNKL